MKTDSKQYLEPVKKHTPGKWKVSWNTFNSGEGHGIYAWGELDLKGHQIAVVNYFPTLDKNANEDTGKANAKLIASAPELAKALQDMISHFEKYFDNFPIGGKETDIYNNAKQVLKDAGL